MVTSCFFCQNLLSDFIEGILPSARQDELKKHMETCRQCSEVHGDLLSTMDLLRALPHRPLSHEMALRITEASRGGHTASLTSVRVSAVARFLAVPLLLLGTLVYSFPKLFPWFWRLRTTDESQFVRYYPLNHGAAAILEEQSNWLHIREPFMRSLWEEGGLSPEEFEKTFQGGRPLAGEKTPNPGDAKGDTQ